MLLEDIASAQPPRLLSIGQTIPRSWSYAAAMLRALRDGSDAIALAKAVGEDLDAEEKADAAAARTGTAELAGGRGANSAAAGGGGSGGGSKGGGCLLYTSPSPRDRQKSRMPSSA